MKALLQRVNYASVHVAEERVGAINKGLLLFVGVEKDDDQAKALKLARKVASYRVFEDDAGKMNLSLKDIGADALVVSQFTLVADTSKGNRPSFSSACAPEQSEVLIEDFVTELKGMLTTSSVETGRFGADMQVSLQNDGPVTFMIQV